MDIIGFCATAAALKGFRFICAWCKADIGPAPKGVTEDSHGICEPCMEREFGVKK